MVCRDGLIVEWVAWKKQQREEYLKSYAKRVAEA